MHIVSAYNDPVPSFTSNSPINIGNDVIFNNTSTEGIPPTEYYLWDFGDGQSFQTDNTDPVNHFYTSPGVYTVTLTAHQVQTGVEVIFSDTVTVKGYIYLPLIVNDE
jgi:PKD repeat protein